MPGRSGRARGGRSAKPRCRRHAVFSRVPLVLDEGKGLGQWELEEGKGLLTVQSGIYLYLKDGKVENKARGVMLSNVDLEAIENRLEIEGVSDKKRKMIAFREALLNKVPAAWKQAAFNPNGGVNPAPI
jgi:hypothetical protein